MLLRKKVSTQCQWLSNYQTQVKIKRSNWGHSYRWKIRDWKLVKEHKYRIDKGLSFYWTSLIYHMFHWKDNDTVCQYSSLLSWISCEQLIEYNSKWIIILQENRNAEISKSIQRHSYFFPLGSKFKSWRFNKRSFEFK
jgi:hypothetical protein